MWTNEDKGSLFMFPPVRYETEMLSSNVGGQHHSRGRGRMRGNYHNSNSGYQRSDSVANKQFYCDTCDRSFENGSLLDEHYAQHKTCGWDGCTFQAHSKIVELHIKMQHETGFADKIMQLNTPEEIEKWKNDRKRNYPTANNIARRQAEQEEKMERGEIIPGKEFGKFQRNGRRNFEGGRGRGRQRTTIGSDRLTNDFGRGGRTHRRRRRANNNNNASNMNSSICNANPTISDDYFGCIDENNVKRFEGTDATSMTASRIISPLNQNAVDGGNGDLITDSEDETAVEAPIETTIARIPKALENLMAAYLSESEEETSTASNIPVIKPQKENRPKEIKLPTRVQQQKKSTLLEMLLDKDIQQERNKIFQCVRYIVENEFFDIH